MDTLDSFRVHYNYCPWANTIFTYQCPENLDCELRLSGVPGPVAIDYGFGKVGSTVNPGGFDVSNPPSGSNDTGTVHLAYINDENELHYVHFFRSTPESLVDQCLDDDIDISSRITGTSIEVDSIAKKIYIAYGCVKDDIAACYYFEKDSNGTWHGPTMLPSSISDSTSEPLVPFLDIDGLFLRAVYNANDKIYYNQKYRYVGYQGWLSPCSLITQMSGKNHYPQIAGNQITWTNYVTTDSSNVWARSLNGSAFRLDTAYLGKSYFCHTTKEGSGSAQLYQHGVFSGPKWAIYYRGSNGFGGNQEREGEPIAFVPKEPIFKMSIPNNILVGSRLSIFTTGGDCRILVYDITGRQIASQDIKDVSKLARIETPLDCNGWAKGVYFVRAVPREGEAKTSRVVLLK